MLIEVNVFTSILINACLGFTLPFRLNLQLLLSQLKKFLNTRLGFFSHKSSGYLVRRVIPFNPLSPQWGTMRILFFCFTLFYIVGVVYHKILSTYLSFTNFNAR